MVLAHVGHWYTELLYVSPVAVVAVGLWVSDQLSKRRDRRAAGEAEAAPPGA